MSGSKKGIKLCLAASGGGHVRQLLDLEPVWSGHDHFFVTEDTALGKSLAADHPTHFVVHYALGQARLGQPFKMMRLALGNLRQSWRIIRQERPDVVISTGAGAVFGVALFGRLTGAKFILIDTFARFEEPSAFAKISRPIAHHVVVQSEKLRTRWPDAQVFDPLRRVEGQPPVKESLLFATVGATLGFDRMAQAIIDLKRNGTISDDVILQTGDSKIEDPELPGLRLVRSLGFDEVKRILERAKIVVTHGGTGSLITALRVGCNVIAMPRAFERGEHYDNHQFEITSAFKARGLIDVAIEADDLPDALADARTRTPVMATTDPAALIDWLKTVLAGWARAT